MPLVKVEVMKGKGEDYKKALLEGIHAALVKTLELPEDDPHLRLFEIDDANLDISSERRRPNLTLIEIIMFQGRSLETKKKLYRAIVENLARNPGIAGEDITIVLQEPPLENFGLSGGKPASEVQIRHRIDV